MNLTRAAIEQNRVTFVALIAVALAGMNAFGGMPRSEDPGFIIRVAQVMTFFPGASPERVEQLVTDKLEKTIQEMPELDFVTSTSRGGVSLVFPQILASETEMRRTWDSLRRKVERASRELPADVIGPFVNDEFGDVFGTIITLTGEGYDYAELKDVADQVRNELLMIPEAAKVEIQGAQEERIFVEYNNARIAELGISAFHLMNTLENRNIVLPGGDVNTGDERIVLEPSGNFESVEELRRTMVDVPGSGQLLYLEDIATVKRGYIDPPGHIVNSSGMPALAISISLREGGNLIQLGNDVKARIDNMRERYPIGIEFDVIAFQPDIVDRKVNDFTNNLLQAIAIVMVVMLISLGLRTGLVVSTLIPMTMVMSLLVMSWFEIGLDQMSLSALIISLGLLVDNAIVMSESIMVGMERGQTAKDSALAAAAELRVPLMTASLTTAAAFLPIYLAESDVGEYTAPLFKVVTIALLCSWTLSLTMIPMLSVQFMRVKAAAGESFDSRLYQRYRGALLFALQHRLLTVIAVIAVFMGAMQLFAFVPNIFFPPKDQAMLTAELEMPIGTPIERTEAMVASLEEFITDELRVNDDRAEGIVNWASFVGQGPPRYTMTYSPKMASPEYAMMLINTTSYDIVEDLIPRIERFCLENFPDVIPDVRMLLNGPPVQDPIEIRISGSDEQKVFALVDAVKQHMSGVPGLKNISDNWGPRTKKLAVNIDQSRARRAGLTSRDVAVSLQTVLSGFQTTEYREGDELIPVTLRSVQADREDIGKLESLNIFSQLSGQSVPLKQVADIEVVWQPSKILRRDRLKTVTVSSQIEGEITALAIFDQLDVWLEQADDDWPLGYRWEFGGEFEASVEANESIGVKLPIAGLIILLLLVGQFNSLRRPAIILTTIPLGLIGVVIGLLLAGSHMGFMTFLGIISLCGIVINNAIVLLDRIKLEIEVNGLEPQKAIIEASQRRLRPIVLTTCTTIGGMLPLWYGGGPMFQPMAVAIIFGILFATMLTLGVVPVLYSILFRVRFKEFS